MRVGLPGIWHEGWGGLGISGGTFMQVEDRGGIFPSEQGDLRLV